jgi:eukaryotic-like serine/threonine-protein kinase
MSEASQSSSSGLDLDLSGRQIGDYRLLRRLGRGAMAEVYLAEQISLRRQVAFKILKRELAKDATYVRRFHMEAQAAAALVHAHIVQIHEVGCVEGVHYIAQEYVAGQNLRELLLRRGPPDVKLVVSIMRQTAAALAKAADQGIVHRDIKPENIMLTKAGEVKVADFGLARISGEGDSLNLTQTGMTMGTPLYMSPEQVEGKPLDPRSDIYSFGVTCYQMLAGEPPFRGETALSVALQHVKAQPERLENRRADAPPGLCRIVHKMLVKDPKERYPDARELLRDLRALEIEGLSSDWPTELDERNTTEAAALGESTIDATRRLDTLMRTQALATRGESRWRRRLAMALAAAFLIGGISALLVRKPFILDASGADPVKIPMQKSATEQFLFAVELGTEAAWKSVGKYFPNDPYVARADQQLARLYLLNDRNDDALKLFEQFVNFYGNGDPKYRAFGFAGECLVYYTNANQKETPAAVRDQYLRDSAKAARELLELCKGAEPDRLAGMLDRQMVRAVSNVLRTTTPKESAAWEQWRAAHFSDDSSAATQN